MKLDLVSIAERLPSTFLPSLMNKLSSTDYIRLRMTCSYMNNRAQAAADRSQLRVQLSEKRLHLVLINGKKSFLVGYKKHRDNTIHIITDVSSIFGFYYSSLVTVVTKKDDDVIMLGDKISSETEQIALSVEYDELTKILKRLKSDTLIDLHGDTAVPQLPFPPDLETDYNIGLEDLTKPYLKGFRCISLEHCQLPQQPFNLLDLCRKKNSLRLVFPGHWTDVRAMVSKFLKDACEKDIGFFEWIELEINGTEAEIMEAFCHRPYTFSYSQKTLICSIHNYYYRLEAKRLDLTLFFSPRHDSSLPYVRILLLVKRLRSRPQKAVQYHYW